MFLITVIVCNRRTRGTFCRLLTFVCGVVPIVESQLCADVDEFYDPVVENCALCRDVCDAKLMPQSITYCRSVCPDYYDKTYSQQQPQQQQPQPQGAVDGQAPNQQEFATSRQPPHRQAMMTSPNSAWTANPLYWVIIASSAVAFMAFVAIVALLIFIRRQRLRDAFEEDGYSSAADKGSGCSPPVGEYMAVSTCSTTPSSTTTESEDLPPSAPASYYVTDDATDIKKPMMTSAPQEKPVSRRTVAEG